MLGAGMARPKITMPPALRARLPEIGWLIAGTWLIGLVAMTAAAMAAEAEPFDDALVRAASMASLGAGFSLLLWRLAIAAPWRLPVRIALLAAGVVGAVAAHTAVEIAAADIVRDLLGEPAPTARIRSNSALRGFVMRLIAESHVLLYAGLHPFFAMAAVAVRSATEARERERLLAEARAATAVAQLAALRHQLSPHFVFNALNALGSLVETGRIAQAGTMIDRLSDFLRSSLGGNRGPFATLDEELSMVQTYLDIEAIRFGDRLRVRYDCTSGLGSALVPSFLLQPLVENAIKHAVSPAMRLVTITLSAAAEGADLILSVADDGAGEQADRGASARGAGVGLKNVRDRLKILYGPGATLDTQRLSTGYLAAARLPLSLAHDGAGHG
jgi:hypothetical protein